MHAGTWALNGPSRIQIIRVQIIDVQFLAGVVAFLAIPRSPYNDHGCAQEATAYMQSCHTRIPAAGSRNQSTAVKRRDYIRALKYAYQLSFALEFSVYFIIVGASMFDYISTFSRRIPLCLSGPDELLYTMCELFQ